MLDSCTDPSDPDLLTSSAASGLADESTNASPWCGYVEQSLGGDDGEPWLWFVEVAEDRGEGVGLTFDLDPFGTAPGEHPEEFRFGEGDGLVGSFGLLGGVVDEGAVGELHPVGLI